MRSFRKFSKSDFIPLYGAPVCPHVEYDMQTFLPSLKGDANHFERIQSLYTRLVIGLRHITYEERLQRMGLHSLPWRRVLANLIIGTCFLTLTPLQWNARSRSSPVERIGLFGEGVQLLEFASCIGYNGSSVDIFKSSMERVGVEVFPCRISLLT